MNTTYGEELKKKTLIELFDESNHKSFQLGVLAAQVPHPGVQKERIMTKGQLVLCRDEVDKRFGQ